MINKGQQTQSGLRLTCRIFKVLASVLTHGDFIQQQWTLTWIWSRDSSSVNISTNREGRVACFQSEVPLQLLSWEWVIPSENEGKQREQSYYKIRPKQCFSGGGSHFEKRKTHHKCYMYCISLFTMFPEPLLMFHTAHASHNVKAPTSQNQSHSLRRLKHNLNKWGGRALCFLWGLFALQWNSVPTIADSYRTRSMTRLQFDLLTRVFVQASVVAS